MKVVVCDTQEVRSGIPAKLRTLHLKVVVRRLRFGDYQVGGLTIERKDVHQFVTDWHSGQLEQQIADLVQHCKHPVLVVEMCHPHPGCAVDRDRVDKCVRRMNHWLPITVTWETGGTAAYIQYCHVKGMELIKVRRPPVVVTGHVDPRIGMLCQVPGIRDVLAQRILDRFRTVDNAIRNVKLWTDVKGIGRKRMLIAVKTFRE